MNNFHKHAAMVMPLQVWLYNIPSFFGSLNFVICQLPMATKTMKIRPLKIPLLYNGNNSSDIGLIIVMTVKRKKWLYYDAATAL